MDPFSPSPIKPLVPFAGVDALDVRLGTIQAVDEVAGSRKLVRLTVGFGDHTRRILAGMKQERDNLAELVGRQALFVVNLAPKSMAGEVSEGMLFDIGQPVRRGSGAADAGRGQSRMTANTMPKSSNRRMRHHTTWFLILLGMCMMGPYVCGVPPKSRRDWIALTITITFLLWLLPALEVGIRMRSLR